MYYLAKGIQALGLVIVLLGFIRRFPELMDPKLLGLGLLVFFTGWIVERFLLKR